METDRRIPRRVPVPAVACRIEGERREAAASLVNLSPEGACLAVPRVSDAASDELTNAWISGAPIRVHLNGGATAGVVRWARGPRAGESRLLFGIRFAVPLDGFGALVRSLLDH